MTFSQLITKARDYLEAEGLEVDTATLRTFAKREGYARTDSIASAWDVAQHYAEAQEAA